MRDLTGQRFHCLTVVGFEQTFNGPRYTCQCSCGKITYARQHALTAGKKKSCGHFRQEVATDRNRTKFTPQKMFPKMLARITSPSGLDIDDSLDELLGTS